MTEEEKIAASKAAAKAAEFNNNQVYQPMVESVARELNANVSFQGLSAKTTKATNLYPALIAVITNLDKICNSKISVPSSVTGKYFKSERCDPQNVVCKLSLV